MTSPSAGSEVSPTAARPSGNALANPWLNVLALVVGVLIGCCSPTLTAGLSPFGKVYIALLQMAVLPILPTAVVLGLARLLCSGKMKRYLPRLLLVYAVAALMGSSLGLFAGTVGLGEQHAASQGFLGDQLMKDSPHPDSSAPVDFWQLAIDMVPPNVFSAFSSGQVLAMLFISILFGAALGTIRSSVCDSLLSGLQATHDAFFRILGWVVAWLPVGLLCLMPGQMALLGADALAALARFLLVFALASVALALLYLLALRIASGQPILHILATVKDPLFLSLCSGSSIAPIPLAIDRMQRGLSLQRDAAGLMIPLGVALNRHSYPMLFALVAAFLSQMYGRAMDWSQCLAVVGISAVIGMAAIGRAAAIAPLIAYVLTPLGLPVASGAAMLISLCAFLDPLVQANIVFGSCTTAFLVTSDGRAAATTSAPVLADVGAATS
jgi:proton glutamate symport protein